MTSRPDVARLGRFLFVAAVLAATGCVSPASTPPHDEPATVLDAEPMANGAISVAPVAADPPTSKDVRKPDADAGVDWSPIDLASAEVSVACDLDFAKTLDEFNVSLSSVSPGELRLPRVARVD